MGKCDLAHIGAEVVSWRDCVRVAATGRLSAQSATAPEAFTAAPHFGTSRCSTWVSPSCEEAATCRPILARRASVSGSRSAAVKIWFSLAAMSDGRPGGPAMPSQLSPSKSMPLSLKVATSGSAGERFDEAVTRILGTSEWETRFYEPPPRARDLLSMLEDGRQPEQAGSNKRTADVDAIEAFVKSRLESIFPLVLPPRRLLGPTKAPLYSLFFAMANKSPQAQAVATPIAKHLLSNT